MSTKRLGIGFDNGRMVWVLVGKSHLRWTPYWFRHALVRVWNPVACAVVGHKTIDLTAIEGHGGTICYHCSKVLVPCSCTTCRRGSKPR